MPVQQANLLCCYSYSMLPTKKEKPSWAYYTWEDDSLLPYPCCHQPVCDTPNDIFVCCFREDEMKNRILILSGFIAAMTMALPAGAAEYYREYEGHHGYREHPYDRGRHYGHYQRRGHAYDYRGHWRSWDDWDRYVRKHPEIRRHGHYYHEGAHLMFRSCSPDAAACVYFSIGR